MKENQFISVSRNQFIEELAKFPFLAHYKDWINETYDESDETEFQVYIGDINNNNTQKFDALNLLVIGNITAKWLSAENNDELYDEGGSLFVTGNIDSEYFSNHYGKLVVIGKSMKVSKILNNAFQDSTLIIQENLSAEYFNGIDIWAEVGGNIVMKYGEGYCLPLGYTNALNQQIKPAHNRQESLAFLGVSNADEVDSEILIYKIMKEKNT